VYADPPLQEIVWYWGNEYRATSLKPGEVDGAFKFDLMEGVRISVFFFNLHCIDILIIEMAADGYSRDVSPTSHK
jgi:hypothetical protein